MLIEAKAIGPVLAAERASNASLVTPVSHGLEEEKLKVLDAGSPKNDQRENGSLRTGCSSIELVALVLTTTS